MLTILFVFIFSHFIIIIIIIIIIKRVLLVSFLQMKQQNKIR